MNLKHLAAFLMLLAVGCTQQSTSESTAPPVAETPVASSTVSFDVTGMTWPNGWGGKIKAALAELPGVTVDEVTVGSVTCSGENLDTAAIAAAIKEVGFGATVANWYRETIAT